MCNAYVFPLFVITFIVHVKSEIVSKEIVVYQDPVNCIKEDTIFNVTTFSCVKCDFQKNLVPSKNNLHCVCDTRSRTLGIENNIPICKLCDSDSIATVDGRNCIKCRNDITENKCSCSSNTIKIERNVHGELLDAIQCVPCPEYTYATSDNSQCLSCHNILFINKMSRTFSNSIDINIEHCFTRNSTDTSNISYVINFDSSKIDSYYLRRYLLRALNSCEDGNQMECEHLSNICTMTLFSNQAACKLFINAEDAKTWLFYGINETLRVLNSKNISQKYSLKETDVNSRLNITVVKYNLNGEFHSVDRPNLFCSFLNNVRFGVNVQQKCDVTAKELQQMNTEFLSFYIAYHNHEKLLLHVLPILVKNTNNIDNISEWQLVRKLFIVDTVSGFGTVLNNNITNTTDPFICRYMKSMEIIVKIQNDKTRSKIHLPLLIVEYGELTEQELLQNKRLSLKYKVTFISDIDVNKAMEISIGVISGVSIIYAVLETWSHCKRNWNGEFHPMLIFWFFIYSFRAISNVLAFVTIFTSIYILVVYKGQTVFHIQLPDESIENSVKLYIVIAMIFKLIEISSFIHKHRNMHIFFIDWEQSRTIHTRVNVEDTTSAPLSQPRVRKKSSISTPKNQKKRRSSSSLSHSRLFSSRESLSIIYKPRESRDGNNIIQYEAHQLPVSIWRTYFVANEWFDLQTSRKISILFQIVSIILILEVRGLKHFASAVPELKLESNGSMEFSFILFYGMGALVYVILYSFQWLFSITIYEKIVKNKIKHFIDLCSVTNISIFILTYEYYGYYIHGRSVHGFADTDLATLINNLQKEENNLCAHRGLVPGTTDQTFVVSISPAFYYFYAKLLNSNSVSDEFWKQNILGVSMWERNLQSHFTVKRFLTGFLDHCFHELDYIIKDRHFLEKVLDIESPTSVDKTIFYIDRDHSFNRTLFYGNEWTLGTFEITLFVFSVAFFRDYVIACLITILISELLVIIFKWNGKRILAQNTLIDNRFLL